MIAPKLMLVPGTLATALDRAAQRAVAVGAMEPIETEEERVEDGGVRFLVRRVSSLARKRLDQRRRAARAAPGRTTNPFLPYEADLFVGEVSDTHVALLNKFNVIDRHLLLVTRRFVHQETPLDRADFAALVACMAEFDALGFYNGGAVAGASQPHKHLQMVPLPLERAEGHRLPVEAAFGAVRGRLGVMSVPGLPFRHAFAWLEASAGEGPMAAADRLEPIHRALLAAVGVSTVAVGGEARQSGPYNLLVTSRWMLAVPRIQEHFDGVSINALGFAGSLFVQDDAQRAALLQAGPMAVLCAVAGRANHPAGFAGTAP
jgi:ATP adenylyltransferase